MGIIKTDILDSAQDMKSLLGTFWQEQFENQTDLNAFLNARAILGRHLEQLTAELKNSRSRVDIQPFAVKKYVPLEFNIDNAVKHSQVYQGGQLPNFGLTFPAIDKLNRVPILCPTPFGSRTYVDGVNFVKEASGEFTFVEDVAYSSVNNTLWGREAEFDEEQLWMMFGYLIGIKINSGIGYKRIINAIMNASINGATISTLINFVRAVFDVPVAEKAETVEVISVDQRGKLIITPTRVYRCDADANILVSAGDVLIEGQFLTDAVKIYYPPIKSLPSEVTSITIDLKKLDPNLTGSITFENTNKTITVTENVFGYTKITWPMPGNATNVSNFFNLLHVNGVNNQKTLANYLDKRPAPQSTQPGPNSLPTEINPLEVLCKMVLRNHYYVITYKESELGLDALGIEVFDQIKQILPPETGYLLVAV